MRGVRRQRKALRGCVHFTNNLTKVCELMCVGGGSLDETPISYLVLFFLGPMRVASPGGILPAEVCALETFAAGVTLGCFFVLLGPFAALLADGGTFFSVMSFPIPYWRAWLLSVVLVNCKPESPALPCPCRCLRCNVLLQYEHERGNVRTESRYTEGQERLLEGLSYQLYHPTSLGVNKPCFCLLYTSPSPRD